ncbi:MAG: LicD family protein [Tannerellaceae bacterium]|jgi:lipopolysaccharide cholinephosphotransferase|nr:LicD family protein [Tannerellaceae bacterium]
MIGFKNISEITEVERKELHSLYLSMYKDIHAVCKKYNLTLMLGGGSALGAVRHQGFIPWDDDMDLMMIRNDYEKFKQIFEEELGDNYELSCPNTKNESKSYYMHVHKKGTCMIDAYFSGWEKYRGVWIEIFPMDNVPNNIILRIYKSFICRLIIFLSNSMKYSQSNNKLLNKNNFYSLRKTIGRLFLLMIKRQPLLNYLDKYSQYSKDTKYLTIVSGRRHYLGEILPRTVFFPVCKKNFEGIEVNLPNDWDTYLKNLYGDYMTPPLISKREKHTNIYI